MLFTELWGVTGEVRGGLVGAREDGAARAGLGSSALFPPQHGQWETQYLKDWRLPELVFSLVQKAHRAWSVLQKLETGKTN